jgi:hypothetical protein
MNLPWVDTKNGNGEPRRDIWAVDYTAHPLLDPNFAESPSRLLKLSRQSYRRILRGDQAYRQELARLFEPLSSGEPSESLVQLKARAQVYLDEADTYLQSTLALLPAKARRAVQQVQLVSQCGDMRQLMGLSIHGNSPRVRYEARRKLFLAQTLLQIDQSRTIQDGLQHKIQFEEMLNRGLWQYSREIHDLQVGFRVSPDGQNMEYSTRPGPHDQRWSFRSTYVEKTHGSRKIGLDVLYYNCRFKMAVTPISFQEIGGARQVLEQTRWSEMRQERSGSVLSKMIRKGINNPAEIGDLIGAMFIVHDNEALTDLLTLLDSCIGTPFGWRNVTDTLAEATAVNGSKGSELNPYSSKNYKVFKGDLDIVTAEQEGGRPYRFPVEIQIYTLESYLRTVCTSHEASHLALKLRQFLFGLVPRLFPRKIYGDHWLEL